MPKAFDFANPPFDRLTAPELERFAACLDVAFFQKGETILRPGDQPSAFYVLIKGAVQELAGDQVIAILGPNDCFDSGFLIERGTRHAFVVQEEVICYVAPIDDIVDLIANNKTFAEFFYRDISIKLDALVARQEVRALQPVTMATVRDAYVRRPPLVPAATSIFAAASRMRAEQASSILVQDGERTGIVTDHDLREKVILERRDLDQPIGPIATYELIGIEAGDLLVEALLRLTRHGLHRLVVYQDGAIQGVLDQIDLLSFLSTQSHIVLIQAERAGSIAELRRASEQLLVLVEVLHGHGTKISYITRLVGELTRRIAAKLFQLLASPALQANACLMVMGSEGRGDQILKTDQDNGLILRDGVDLPEVEQFGAAFTEALISFGYPRCPGNIMVSNPVWAKPLAAYQADLLRWLTQPDETALMNLAIFLDAAPVAGDASLLQAAKAHLAALASGNRACFARFARPIDSFDTPLGIFSHLIASQGADRDALDLKRGGIFPIVHGVRALAFEQGLSETNTVERIKQLTEQRLIEPAFATDLTEAYSFMLGLRLQTRLDQMRLEQPPDNLIRPQDLNRFERDLLKDSLVIVNKFKERIRYHFNLKML